MALTVRFGNAMPQASTLVSAPQTAQVRFGRDEIFERNDRFEKTGDGEAQQKTALTRLLQGSLPKGAEAATALTKLQDASAFLYNGQGRIRGKAAVGLALDAARREADLADAAKSTPSDKAFVQLKLANALLASDQQDDAALKMLDEALKTLDKAKFKPTDAQRPTYMHAVYNRGTHFMNNPLYKETARMNGPIEMALSNAVHEGLTLAIGPGSPLIPIAKKRLEEGLPFIDKAIALADQMDDNGVSKAEYLSARGEALHLIAHMIMDRAHLDEREVVEEDALNAFKQAMDVLEAIPDAQQTERHSKLIEKIGTVKIPHLCDHPHEVMYTGPGCMIEQNRAQELMAGIQIKGLPVALDTPAEAEAKELIAEHERMQAKLDELRRTDPMAFRRAMFMYQMGLNPFPED